MQHHGVTTESCMGGKPSDQKQLSALLGQESHLPIWHLLHFESSGIQWKTCDFTSD